MSVLIENLLEGYEKVLFTGTYNINSQVNNGITATIITQIETNPDGYNVLVDNYYNSTDGLIPPNKLLLEYNNIVSYLRDFKTKVGQIQYTALYLNNGQENITTEPIIIYEVNNASGIYSKVTKVILNASEDQRILYFIGKECCDDILY